ncbi:MAG: type II secretion system F family protein, partial [Patescibacteria group bacterium]
MKFKYKAQKKDGGVIEGVKDSPDKFTLARELREQGSTPVLIEEAKDKAKLSFGSMSLFSKVSLSEKIVFTNNLSGMLMAGLSLTRALTIFEKQTTNPAMKKVLTSLIDSINSGNTLSDG